MENNRERRFGQIIFSGGCLLALASLVIQIIAACNDSIWSDEAFSVRLTQLPLSQMLSITARDVHPPLYYLSLRLFSGILRLIVPSLSVIMTAKLHSVLYMALLTGLLAVKLRKTHGPLTAGLSLAMLFVSASFVSYGVEIRMYTMAAFFVTGASLSACTLLRASKGTPVPESAGTTLPANAGALRSYLPLILWSLSASYTNYYACIAVFFLWLYLLIVLLFQQQKTLPAFFKSAGLTVLLYLPWLVIALRQFGEVSDNESYWIEPLSRREILSWLLFVFNDTPLLMVTGIVIVLAALVLSAVYGKKEDRIAAGARDSLLCCAPVLGVFLAGLIVSVLFRPVFVARYLLPAVPAMWCGMAMALAVILRYLKNASATAAMILCTVCLAACALICIGNLRDFHAAESNLAEETEKLCGFYEALGEDDVIVTTNSHLNVNFAFLTDCECNMFDYEESPVFIETFPNIRNMYDISDAEKRLEAGRHVYFLETDSDLFLRAAEVFLPERYRLEDRGNYFMEGPLTVYEVFLKR